MHIQVDGQWMNDVAPWDPSAPFSHDEHGCQQLTLSAYLSPGERHPALHRGAVVEALLGPCVIWSGYLDEPDWTTGQFHAKGPSYQAGAFLALDAGGNSTAVPSVALDEAIDRGWAVTRDASVPTAPFTATPEGVNTLGALLDSQADELGQRWSVRADRAVRMEADATSPDYVIGPGIVTLGNASDEYASAVVVRYQTLGGMYATTIRTDLTAAARFGYKEIPLDLVELGGMDLARAQGYGDGILAKGKARLGWTSVIEVTADQLLTPGGSRSDLRTVRNGQLVRIYGTVDDLVYLDGRLYLDVAIGSTNYQGGSTLTIGPVGSVAQTLSEAITELHEKRPDQ